MYSYRIKVPTFYLGCLMLIMAMNVFGSYGLRSKLANLPPPPPAPLSNEAFAAQLASTTAPDKLRELASQEHRRVVAGGDLIRSFDALCRLLVRNAVWSSWTVLALTILYYLSEFKPPPR